MIAAIEDINLKKLSYREAASCIPRSTLFDHVSGKVEIGQRSGPLPVLTPAEEKKLVQYTFNVSAIGYGQTREQVLEMVRKIVEKDGRSNPFKDNKPGKKWWKLFHQRNPEVSLRIPEPLQLARAKSCTPEAIAMWFRDFGQFLDVHGLKYEDNLDGVSDNSDVSKISDNSISDTDTDTQCYLCGCTGNTEVGLWVACDSCESWCYAECTNIDPKCYEDIEFQSFICDNCQ